MKKLSLGQLRAIDAVVTNRNFSDAAKALGISQPAVSNHVNSVEGHFRTRLFDRRGYVAVPTPELEALLPRLRTVLMLMDELENSLEKQRSLVVGQLRVGYSTYQTAVPILTRFMQDNPGVKVEARAMASHDLLQGLENGDLDVGCMTAKEVPAHLSGVLLRKMKVVLAVPRGHPMAATGKINFSELNGVPLIQREVTSATRRIFEAAARLARVELNTILAVGSWGTISEMVRTGLGVGVGLDAEVTATGLVPVEITDAPMSASQFVVHLPERKMISAVQAFMTTTLLVSAPET